MGKQKKTDLDLFESSMFWLKLHRLDFRNLTKFSWAWDVLTILFLTFQAVFTFMLLRIEQGIPTISSITESVPIDVQTVVKMIAVLYHRKKLVKLSKALKSFWKWDIFGKKLERNVLKIHTFMYRMYILYVTINLSTLLLFMMKPVLMRVWMLPSFRYDWCDVENIYCFFALYACQVVEFFYVCTINTAFDAFFIGMMTYLYSELEIVKYGFQNYVPNGNYPKTYAQLIEHHDQVLSLIKDMSEVCSFIMLFQMGATVLTTCIEAVIITLLGYPIDLGGISNRAAFVVCYLIEFGIYCVGGTNITTQTESVARSVYDSPWIEYDEKHRKAIVFIIERAQRPVIMKIGEMSDLNLETFTSVLNFTLSFATLMQNVL